MTDRSIITRLDASLYPGMTRHWDSQRFREYLLQVVTSSDRILDLGAGRGRMPEMNLQGIAAHVTGIDPDPCVLDNPFLDEAIVHDGRSSSLPFADASYDLVVTSNVLEHVRDPVGLFREVHRVLRPGGLFVSKTPNRYHYVALIASVTPHKFHEWVNVRRGRNAADTYPTLYRVNSRPAVRRLAAQTGFELVMLTTWEGPPSYLRIVPLLYPLGVAYERVVNSVPALAGLRAVLVSSLRKRP